MPSHVVLVPQRTAHRTRYLTFSGYSSRAVLVIVNRGSVQKRKKNDHSAARRRRLLDPNITHRLQLRVFNPIPNANCQYPGHHHADQYFGHVPAVQGSPASIAMVGSKSITL